MKRRKSLFLFPITALIVFIIFTILVKTVDVIFIPDVGYLGFHNINFQINDFINTLNKSLFNKLSNVLLIVAFLTILPLAIIGIIELIKRKSLLKVDLVLYFALAIYILIAILYFVFGLMKINFSPDSVKDNLKDSYPSSHVLISVSLLFVNAFACFTYLKNKTTKMILLCSVSVLSICSVITRMFSGAHYFTDIIGGILLSFVVIATFWAITKFLGKEKLIIK